MNSPYRLCNIVYHYGAVCVSVVHGSQRLVALLSRGVPNLKLDCRLLIEGEGLCEECSADSGFSVVVELILLAVVSVATIIPTVVLQRTLTKRRTRELFPTADSPSDCQYDLSCQYLT